MSSWHSFAVYEDVPKNLGSGMDIFGEKKKGGGGYCIFINNHVTFKWRKQILLMFNILQIAINVYRICITGVYISH